MCDQNIVDIQLQYLSYFLNFQKPYQNILPLEKIQRILLIWNTIEHQAQVYHLWIVFLSFSSNYINYVQPQRPDFIYIASFDFRLSQKWDRHLVNLMMRILYFRREFCKFSLLKKWKKNTSRINLRITPCYLFEYFLRIKSPILKINKMPRVNNYNPNFPPIKSSKLIKYHLEHHLSIQLGEIVFKRSFPEISNRFPRKTATTGGG